MDKLPKEIKSKIRKLNRKSREIKNIQQELSDEFKKYGFFDLDVFDATAGLDIKEQTEWLAHITYGEIDPNNKKEMKEALADIERVFLIHYNKMNGEN